MSQDLKLKEKKCKIYTICKLIDIYHLECR